MSKTDKTDPVWLKHARDGLPQHDHSGDGECRPDSIESARRRERSRVGYRHRAQTCPAYAWSVVTCEQACCYYRFAEASYAALGMPYDNPCSGVHYRLAPTGDPCSTCEQAYDDNDVCVNRVHLGSYVRSLTLYKTKSRSRRARVRLSSTKPRRQAERRAATAARREWNAGYRPDDEQHPELEDHWDTGPGPRRGCSCCW